MLQSWRVFLSHSGESAAVCEGRLQHWGVVVGDRTTVLSHHELEFDTATAASLPRLVLLLDEEAEAPGIPLGQPSATRAWRNWWAVPVGLTLCLLCQGAGWAHQAVGQGIATRAGSNGADSLDLGDRVAAWLSQFGPLGWAAVLSIAGWVVSQAGWVVNQAQNLETIRGWLQSVWRWLHRKLNNLPENNFDSDRSPPKISPAENPGLAGSARRIPDVGGQNHQGLGGVLSTPTWNWPRPWDFSGYILDKRRHFTGRQWLFDQVRGWYHDQPESQALLIVADFGVGKSAFMAELTDTGTGQRQLPILAHHFCDHNTAATLEPASFVRSLAAQLAESLPSYRAAVEADAAAQDWLDQVERDPASAFSQAVTSKLAAIEAPDTPQLLLIDGLDETLGAVAYNGKGQACSIVALLAGATRRLPPWIRVLATTRRRQEVRQPLGQAYSCQELDGEQTANLDDISDYILERCQAEPLAAILAAAGHSLESVATLLRENSGGKFLYAVLVLNDLAKGAMKADQLRHLPPGIDGFYLDAFGRRFPGNAYTPLKPLLGILCEAREPIDQAALADILARHPSQLKDDLRQLEDFLRISSKGRGPAGITAATYAFDHLSLPQWLREDNNEGFARAAAFTVDGAEARQKISLWAQEQAKAGSAHQWPYLTRHIGAHLDSADGAEVLASLLFNVRWLEARLRWADPNALLADFQRVNQPRLGALERVLRQASHVLVAHPEQLPSQLLARWPESTTSQPPSAEQRLRQQAITTLQQRGGAVPLGASLRGSEALLRTLVGHTNVVLALAALPDGRLASGSDDRTIRLWNLNRGSAGSDPLLFVADAGITALAVMPRALLPGGQGPETSVLVAGDGGGRLHRLNLEACRRQD